MVFTAWIGLGAFMVPKFNDKPLGPWDQVGSKPYLIVVNPTGDPKPIAVLARKVDHSVRFLGWVQPQDSAQFVLPYADTQVTLLVGSSWIEFRVKDPTAYRVYVTDNLPRPPRSEQ